MNTVVWPIFRRMPSYLRLGLDLARDPAIPHRHKLLLYSTVAYQVSPIHLLVTPIPILGQFDFPVLLLLSIRQMIVHSPQEVSRRHFIKLKMDPAQFENDLDSLLKLGGDVASNASHRIRTDARFAGRVVRFMGLRSLARLVVATEKHRAIRTAD